MPTDVKKAIAEYGYVGTLANSVPELKKILLAMAAKNASVEEFTRAVQDSNWWKNSADSIKQNQVLKATKPGEFAAQRGNMVTKVRLLAAQMGVGLGEGKGSMLGHIVDMAMSHGWDDTTLKAQIGHNLQGSHDKYGGQAASTLQSLKKLYSDYGVKYSENAIGLQTRSILDGSSTIERVQMQLMASAKSRYAALAPDIDAGRTVADIADPYIQQMASTLEIPPGTINMYDPKIQSALSVRDVKTGVSTVKPLWSFEQELKNDPRWDKTKNAVNSAYDQAMRIGKDWGFVG